MSYIVECKNCGDCTEHDLRAPRPVPLFPSASEPALAEAHAEIARLTAECDRVKEELKEALVGVSYGRMCEKELFALRRGRTAIVPSSCTKIFRDIFSPEHWAITMGLVAVLIGPSFSAWLLA